MEQPLSKTPRIEVVDALRGFAVMAIILVHNLEHFIFPVYPTDSPAWLNILDQGVLNTVFSCLPERPMPFSPCFSDLPSTFNATIRRNKERTSATAFCGASYCLQVSPR